MRNKWIYIIYDIKSLLIRELERFYLPLKDPKEFFQNDLQFILYNKKIIIIIKYDIMYYYGNLWMIIYKYIL